MTTTNGIRRPLEGMLVLDLGQIYNGPYCGLLLGFMGARVLDWLSDQPQVWITRRVDIARHWKQVHPTKLSS